MSHCRLHLLPRDATPIYENCLEVEAYHFLGICNRWGRRRRKNVVSTTPFQHELRRLIWDQVISFIRETGQLRVRMNRLEGLGNRETEVISRARRFFLVETPIFYPA